jgi:hypothetical protein
MVIHDSGINLRAFVILFGIFAGASILSLWRGAIVLQKPINYFFMFSCSWNNPFIFPGRVSTRLLRVCPF